MKPFTLILNIIIVIICILHTLRIVFDIDILINSWYVPFWVNGVLAVITAFLAIMLWKENKGNGE